MVSVYLSSRVGCCGGGDCYREEEDMMMGMGNILKRQDGQEVLGWLDDHGI